MKLALLIPAYNEAKVLASVLEALPRHFSGFDEVEAIVINDGSADSTSEIAEAHGVVVLDHLINRGLGGALGTGLEYAKRSGADVAVTLDADGQHDPAEINKLIAPILEERADFVVGSRLKGEKGMPIDRLIGNWGLNVITYLVYRVWTTDSQSGFRAFSRKAIERIELQATGMEVSSAFFSAVRQHGLIYEEVPIRPIYTTYSRAKGQRNWNGFRIVFRLLYDKFLR